MTPYLQFSTALSKLDWENIMPLANQLNIPNDEILPMYEEIKGWVNDTLNMK